MEFRWRDVSINLKKLRKLKGYKSQDDLAKAVGCSKSMIRNLEAEKSKASLELLDSIATVLGVHVIDLIKPSTFEFKDQIITPESISLLLNSLSTHSTLLAKILTSSESSTKIPTNLKSDSSSISDYFNLPDGYDFLIEEILKKAPNEIRESLIDIFSATALGLKIVSADSFDSNMNLISPNDKEGQKNRRSAI